MKYAIGLIMKHKVLGYLCVITGWDARRVPSAKRMNEMNVDADTFYKVFVDDGSCQYVAQGNASSICYLLYKLRKVKYSKIV